MTWQEVMYTQAAALLAADTLTLAAAGDLLASLVAAPFTPSQTTPSYPPTNAVNSGLAATVVPASVDVTQDPSNGDILIDLKPPSGGWRWESTSVFVGPSETIYGLALSNQDSGQVIGSFLFDVPVVITAAGQVVTVDQTQMRLRLSTPFLQ